MSDNTICGTCGGDINSPGQWLRCRAHYTETIKKLEEKNRLSKNEMTLASRLLRMAADKFSNHGCSDFDLELPEHEAREILIERERWNGDMQLYDELRAGGHIPEYDSDWYMMAYLSAKLKALAEGRDL